jgi:hypothetical protein
MSNATILPKQPVATVIPSNGFPPHALAHHLLELCLHRWAQDITPIHPHLLVHNFHTGKARRPLAFALLAFGAQQSQHVPPSAAIVLAHRAYAEMDPSIPNVDTLQALLILRLLDAKHDAMGVRTYMEVTVAVRMALTLGLNRIDDPRSDIRKRVANVFELETLRKMWWSCVVLDYALGISGIPTLIDEQEMQVNLLSEKDIRDLKNSSTIQPPMGVSIRARFLLLMVLCGKISRHVHHDMLKNRASLQTIKANFFRLSVALETWWIELPPMFKRIPPKGMAPDYIRANLTFIHVFYNGLYILLHRYHPERHYNATRIGNAPDVTASAMSITKLLSVSGDIAIYFNPIAVVCGVFSSKILLENSLYETGTWTPEALQHVDRVKQFALAILPRWSISSVYLDAINRSLEERQHVHFVRPKPAPGYVILL